MRPVIMIRGSLAALILLLAGTPTVSADESAAFTLATLCGRVVYLAEATEQRTGVATVPESKEALLALETKSGDLVPILEDVRGRAFRRDARLREMQVELVVRRYRSTPQVQILRVFEVSPEGRFEIDYWCVVCSIAMFELKDCECCQAVNELRRTKADRTTNDR